MSEINIWSFLSVVLFQLVGAYFHWRKMHKAKRVTGTFWDYLVADSPGHSVATGLAILSAAWLSTSSGAGDLINPELVVTMLANGILHVPSVNGIVAAIAAGYMFDSMINKGERGFES
jgi:hypothetical protein